MVTDKCNFQGRFFPIFRPGEKDDLPNVVRIFLYLIGLAWLFLAVAVVSDVFMNGIEKITSAKKRMTDKKTGRKVTVYVWNATVANLTLMALGSSAPEILLSLIEISSDNFFLGPLGAGTIVGSAAFNLLVISAVCVCAIPDGEVRFIKETHVYIITASFSVFAYIWLLLMVKYISPDVCELWEAVLTLVFTPILVVLSYMADRGFFKRKRGVEQETGGSERATIADDVTEEELAQIETEIRQQHGQNLTDEQVVKIMRIQYFQNHSRAWYRHQAMQAHLHGSQVSRSSIPPSEYMIQEISGTSDEVDKDKQAKMVKFGWASDTYSFVESVGKAKLAILRAGPKDCKAQVRYTTVEGTAKKEMDFDHVDEVIIFEKDEVSKEISINIKDDEAWEPDEQFTVVLSEPKADETSGCTAEVSQKHSITTINIIDDDDPGELRFEVEEVEFGEDGSDHVENIVVTRFNGATGEISCHYYTDPMKATEGTDFEGIKGTLKFENGQKKATIAVTIKGRTRVQPATFNLVLKEPTNTKFDPKTDGGEDMCICHITVKHRDKAAMFTSMKERIHSANAIAGHKNWAQQFHDAIFKVGDDDDEDEEPAEGDEPKPKDGASKMDIVMHIIAVPWKLLFAFIPPVDYCGGWACFFTALCFIGIVTWWVSDMANLVGCCLGLLPEENAIMFVALGTSLPDTFASQTAAMMDPYADASIGNVTGSNSVNVFLGIGISWCFAAIYWSTVDWASNPEYVCRMGQLTASEQANIAGHLTAGGAAVFMTPAGTIWFNVLVFSANAFFAIQHLFARREKWGGELGGPKKGFFGQYFSASFLVFQWIIYISAASIFMRTGEGALTYKALSESSC